MLNLLTCLSTDVSIGKGILVKCSSGVPLITSFNEMLIAGDVGMDRDDSRISSSCDESGTKQSKDPTAREGGLCCCDELGIGIDANNSSSMSLSISNVWDGGMGIVASVVSSIVSSIFLDMICDWLIHLLRS